MEAMFIFLHLLSTSSKQQNIKINQRNDGSKILKNVIFLDLLLKGSLVYGVIHFVNKIKIIYTSKGSLIRNPEYLVSLL